MASSTSGRGQRRSVGAMGQEELRRLMRTKQRESAAGKTKIDSPYVRYNSLGNLSCSLCNVTVKSELLWQTHAHGKQHKERLESLKNIKHSTPKSFPETSSSLKRKLPETRILDQKKGQDCNDHPQAVSSRLPKDFFDKTEQTEVEIISSKGSSAILLGNHKSEEGKKEMTKDSREKDGKTSLPITAQHELSSDLVPKSELVACSSTDYLENSTLATPQLSHSESVQKAEPQEKNHQRRENTAEALPEGFFDDPEVDAKVRKVDTPKDQMDKEWEEFQKAMRQINTISEAIVAEEDEEGRLDRQIGEIDEQMECFRRVEQLRDLQEIRKYKLKEAMRQTITQTKEAEDIDSNDEGELQDLLSQDWRAKGTIL
ncbi:zinc finger protein 830 [Pseudonaja textilis]|uniref:Zinc finger protein 830 n=1 Tax=Pseudonaja textilis TaxID=8673 RepID=A0A670ZN85_PSETE|nr:zinc finger protein 830 [Pseudonaja textilis]